MMSKINIDINKPKKEFDDFLGLIGNHRIIFSGAFGMGKTYFLKKYFDKHDKYISLHLYPTNYSVSQSADIFELIKYDVLYELLKHDPQLEKIEFSFLDKLTFLNLKDTARLISPFMELIPEIGKDISIIIAGILKLNKVISERTKGFKLDDGELIKSFAQQVEQSRGNVYENDFYTQLIQKLIDQLRTEQKKEVVLVIDDLDRIDPEHVFRILNVFASHLDIEDKVENKFGINKVVVCCDIENIRAVFHSKYGGDVDFNGYIDKFYSREIFQFDNTSIVLQSITQVLNAIRIDDRHKEINYISLADKYYFRILLTIVASLVGSNTINLRTLLRLVDRDYQLPTYFVQFGSRRIKNWQILIIVAIDFLAMLYGDKQNLVKALRKTTFITEPNSALGVDSDHLSRLVADLLLLTEFNQHNLRELAAKTSSVDGYLIQYEVHVGRLGYDEVYFADVNHITFEATNEKVQHINYKNLLLRAIEIYYEKKGK